MPLPSSLGRQPARGGRSLLLLALPLAGSPLLAQRPATDTAARSPTPPPAARAPGAEIGGVLFLSYVSGGPRAERRAGSPNRFDVDRAYITLRSPSGERLGYRITADVYQQRDSTRDGYYRGWGMRTKYAYATWDALQGTGSAPRAQLRLGMVQTHVIEHEEGFWLRGIAPTALDQSGYFSSADVGTLGILTLPRIRSELHVGIYNGSGYAARENDRFKDVAARVTVSPLRHLGGFRGSLAVSPWYYRGFRASDFLRRQGTLDPVTAGVRKDRAGVHAAVRDGRLTLGGHLAWRMDGVERADTMAATRPTVTTRSGRLWSAYAVTRPLAFMDGHATSRLNTLLRVDDVRPDAAAPPAHRQVIAGLGWSLSSRGSAWLTYHNQDPRNGSTASDVKALMVQAIVTF